MYVRIHDVLCVIRRGDCDCGFCGGNFGTTVVAAHIVTSDYVSAVYTVLVCCLRTRLCLLPSTPVVINFLCLYSKKFKIIKC